VRVTEVMSDEKVVVRLRSWVVQDDEWTCGRI
jgi:hypothetical protein